MCHPFPSVVHWGITVVTPSRFDVWSPLVQRGRLLNILDRAGFYAINCEPAAITVLDFATKDFELCPKVLQKLLYRGPTRHGILDRSCRHLLSTVNGSAICDAGRATVAPTPT
jgi:hypothetical protein